MWVRVIKTVVAVFISIYLAQSMHLDFALSAGLLAILGIDVTLRRSMRSVAVRILSTITALVLASIFFHFLGFSIWTISLYILLIYPVLVRVKMADGVVSSSVIVFHIVDKQEVTLANIGNEIMLLLISMVTATVINVLYMPRSDKELAAVRRRVEELFASIFLHIAEHLKDPSTVWDGKELLEAPDAIRTGAEIARRAAENKLFQAENTWLAYFGMRRQHFDSILRMVDLVAQVFQSLPHGEAVARLFKGLSEDVKSETYAGKVEALLVKLEHEFKQMPLPATREEFEMRSALLQLCLELKTYLSMSKRGKRPASPEAVQKR